MYHWRVDTSQPLSTVAPPVFFVSTNNRPAAVHAHKACLLSADDCGCLRNNTHKLGIIKNKKRPTKNMQNILRNELEPLWHQVHSTTSAWDSPPPRCIGCLSKQRRAFLPYTSGMRLNASKGCLWNPSYLLGIGPAPPSCFSFPIHT